MGYKAEARERSVILLDDGKMSSFYLVAGKEAALLVDTGMAEEPLRPYVEQMTNKPLSLAVTHGHGDHVAHAGEFDTVYMNPKDLAILPSALKRLGIAQNVDPDHFLSFTDGQTIAAWEFSLRGVEVGGHTPGSMIYYEEKRHLLFTGDAVGSGVDVWMQLAGCAPLSQYRQALLRLAAFWETLPADTLVFSGHAAQRYMHPSGDNPVCLDMVYDMVTLCGRILEGKQEKIAASPIYVREISPAYAAEYGRASMIYTDQVIR